MKQSEYNKYQVGVMKRKFKMGKGDFEPGALITQLNAQKEAAKKKEVEMPTKEKVAIMGAI